MPGLLEAKKKDGVAKLRLFPILRLCEAENGHWKFNGGPSHMRFMAVGGCSPAVDVAFRLSRQEAK